MPHDYEAIILNAAGADAWVETDVIQNLWSGYGQIVRYRLTGGAMASPDISPKKARHSVETRIKST